MVCVIHGGGLISLWRWRSGWNRALIPHAGGVRMWEGQASDWQGQGSGSGPQGSITREAFANHSINSSLWRGSILVHQ